MGRRATKLRLASNHVRVCPIMEQWRGGIFIKTAHRGPGAVVQRGAIKPLDRSKK